MTPLYEGTALAFLVRHKLEHFPFPEKTPQSSSVRRHSRKMCPDRGTVVVSSLSMWRWSRRMFHEDEVVVCCAAKHIQIVTGSDAHGSHLTITP